ncbi:hypothetical protein [Nostoc sphaeroides]|uniref:hypothetical protein n=1 Tax=Nostoc sphaeroides TaxID=446679 RepID=UPI001CEC50D6|nr:hypothetical protein [Nostoc sphaeroides]
MILLQPAIALQKLLGQKVRSRHYLLVLPDLKAIAESRHQLIFNFLTVQSQEPLGKAQNNGH